MALVWIAPSGSFAGRAQTPGEPPVLEKAGAGALEPVELGMPDAVGRAGVFRDPDADAPLPGYDPSHAEPVELSPMDNEYLRLGGDDEADETVTGQGEQGRIVRKGMLREGEDADTMFKHADKGSAKHFLKAARRLNPGGYAPGRFYSVVCDGNGKVLRFEYERDEKKRLVVEGDGPEARLEDIAYDVRLTGVVCIVRDDIFQAVQDVKEYPKLASMLSDVFGTEINFLKDVREGDSFAIVVEKRYQNGNFYGYGRIISAKFTSRAKGETYETFLFPDAQGGPQYYNYKGENTRRAYLCAPLAVTRITSKFTMSRKHPILGYSRPHQGVDYAAPVGTPVKAVSNGVVTARGWGGEAGNRIILKHPDGMESLYSHLSGFARGLKNGSRVEQGQVIGYVGSTGLSTGPHLDFRLRKGDKYLDPSKALNPRNDPVRVADKKNFARVRDLEMEYVSGRKPLAEYDPSHLR